MPNEQQREAWNSPNIGKEWSGAEPISDVATPIIFEALDLRPGERVLDLACGGGKTMVRAAQAVGESGRVTGVNISAGMIGLAVPLLQRRGLFRTAYEGETLRAHYGLEQPESQFD